MHDRLWKIFASVENRKDLEQYRKLLVPRFTEDDEGNAYDIRQPVREDFYEALTAFGLCLKVALSSRTFFEDTSFTEELIRTYKNDLSFFTTLRKIAKQDAQETVDYSAYEEQIRRLVDKYVVGTQVKEAEGVILVTDLEKAVDPKSWSEDRTRNETDIIRSRLKKTITQELVDDPYTQLVFSELLKLAIADAEALFDHPYKQYMLFKEFEEKVKNRDLETVPDVFGEKRRARAYYGTFRLVLGDELFETIGAGPGDTQPYVDEAFAIDETVKTAVAEHSVNPQNIEAEIRRALLPRLFNLVGLDKAKDVIERVIQITRVGLNRGKI